MCDETNMTEAGAERDRGKKTSKSVCVYDCRPESSAATGRTIDIANMDYNGFLQALRRVQLFLLLSMVKQLFTRVNNLHTA